MSTRSSDYRGYRFPPEIISYAVWLYHRFCLSFRDVEELLAERGVTVSYEAVRLWCLKFGQAFANRLRHRRSRFGDTWHLDEVFVTIRGQRHYWSCTCSMRINCQHGQQVAYLRSAPLEGEQDGTRPACP